MVMKTAGESHHPRSRPRCNFRSGHSGCIVKILLVIARSKATKQSSLSSRPWMLRGACHRARIRATRWLAMTARHVAWANRSVPTSRVLQRDAEFGFGLRLDLVERDAVGELDQCHALVTVLVDGEYRQIRHHQVDHLLAGQRLVPFLQLLWA